MYSICDIGSEKYIHNFNGTTAQIEGFKLNGGNR